MGIWFTRGICIPMYVHAAVQQATDGQWDSLVVVHWARNCENLGLYPDHGGLCGTRRPVK